MIWLSISIRINVRTELSLSGFFLLLGSLVDDQPLTRAVATANEESVRQTLLTVFRNLPLKTLWEVNHRVEGQLRPCADAKGLDGRQRRAGHPDRRLRSRRSI